MKPRSAQPADLPGLARIHAAAFAAPWTAHDIEVLSAEPGVLALVAEDGPVRGFILARMAGEEAEILTLAVDPDMRRRGAGRALVLAAAAQTRLLGAGALFLEVAQDNPAALALYAGLGFEAAGRRTNYYARPDGGRIDALILRRALNSGKA